MANKIRPEEQESVMLEIYVLKLCVVSFEGTLPCRVENALISKSSSRFVRSCSHGGGVSQEGTGTVQSGPSMFLIKHGQAQPEQRPLRVPPPHLFPKSDRNNSTPLPSYPTKQKKREKKNNRCHFQIARNWEYSFLFDVQPPLFCFDHYTNKRQNQCRFRQMRSDTVTHVVTCWQAVSEGHRP